MNKPFAILLSMFVFLFLGFNAAQQYLTTFFELQSQATISLISLSLIYGCFFFSGFVAPYAIKKLGTKGVLIVSSLMYAVYIFTVLVNSVFVLLLSSLLLGIAAGLLWAAQGFYIIKITTEKNRGFLSGLFFSSTFGLVGLLLFGTSYVITPSSIGGFYLLFGVLSSIGVLLSFFLPPIKDQKKEKIASPLHLFIKQPQGTYLFYAFASQFMASLIFSSIPLYVLDTFGIAQVGLTSGIFFLTLVVVAIFVGKISDKVNIFIPIHTALSLGVVGLLLVLFTKTLWIYIVGLVFMSIVHSTSYALSFPFISKYFSRQLKEMSSLRASVTALATLMAVFLTIFLPYVVMIGIGLAGLVISLVLFKVYRRKLPN